MKYSFSTKGWTDCSFGDFVNAAESMGFSGIELHNVHNDLFTDKNSPLYAAQAKSTVRELYRKHLSIPCIDACEDIGCVERISEAKAEIRECIEKAAYLGIGNIRLRAEASDDKEKSAEAVTEVISGLLQEAEEKKITLLLETSGLFADTALLRDMLERFASDYLAALWNMPAAYFEFGERPAEVIKNLGAYVRHVHLYDGIRLENGYVHYQLLGEGELPVKDLMLALRSVNYDGFISLVWNPSWEMGYDDMEIVFPQFISYMRQFSDPSRNEPSLYWNRAHTGRYVWKKETIIDETFPQVLDRMCKEFPDQYAFKYTTLDYTRTYTQFRDDVDEFARALIAMGVRPGSHVAVWASNVPQWYISFWATVKIGAVLVTVNTAYRISEAEYLFKQSDTHTLVLTEGNKDIRYGDIVAELCPELENTEPGKQLHAKRLPFLRNVITVGFRQKGCMEWSEAVARASEVPVEEVYRLAARVDKDDVANMQYTSGTTGFPKGVMLTHHNIVNNGKCIGDRMDLSTADRMMIQVPMFHCFGMVLAMTASMTHGVSLHPIPYFSPKSSLACIHNEHITAFHGVPTMFIALLSHPDFEKTDFSYMRTGIMAGSPCPIATMKEVVEKMHMTEITIVYGQTEASPGCTMSSTDDSIEVRVSTVGHALPEIECKIVDPETGEDCPDEVIGEFVARGYNIMKGYYKMPEATAAAIDKEGWLHTGDLACRMPDGNYKITGRLKDMIIRGGENIYPKEIEEFLYTYPEVNDVQVIGVPDEQYGEEVMACIILKENSTATEAEIREYMMKNIAKHKVPKYITFVDAFPMNAAGKILKYQMREEAVKSLNLQKAASIETA